MHSKQIENSIKI